MRSFRNVGFYPSSLTLPADGILEFHAARILLLLALCGTANRIDGLTKLAKLDFFVRYPDFYEIAKAAELKTATEAEVYTVESAMVRHHYGPWDKRYYHVLAYLEGNGLVDILKVEKAFELSLTEKGKEFADTLKKNPAFNPIVERMKDVKKVFGKKSGSALKSLIYKLFDAEIVQKQLGEIIE